MSRRRRVQGHARARVLIAQAQARASLVLPVRALALEGLRRLILGEKREAHHPPDSAPNQREAHRRSQRDCHQAGVRWRRQAAMIA